jgi:2-dehydro-3-deoxyphosphogluconate aldolase / (4S)-4-hydroxy-2-oxoglutarate aldolase
MGFTKGQIIDVMRNTGLVPLFSHDDAEVALQVVATAYDGGARVFEFTNRRPNSYDVFCHLVKHRNRYPELMLGIGTVMDGASAQRFIDAGADFIISPILKLEMGAVCQKNNVLWIPGCATLTEIITAKEGGAEVIKVFPGSVLGPGFVSSIKPVVPDLQLMITGGVENNEKNLSEWFKAGAMCVGMGSQLFTKELIEGKDWIQLKQQVADLLKVVRKVRM